MNLSQLLQSGPDLAVLRGLALILSPELHGILEAVQAQLPPRTCVAQAMPMTDGRYMLGADLLSEIGPGGLYHDGFGQLPQDALPLVQVLPMADALALLPEPEPEQ
jgi:hypothetical protein